MSSQASDGADTVQNPSLSHNAMRRLLAALLFLATFGLALVSGVRADYSIHVGARTPPAEAHCRRVGTRSTDEGRLLNVYVCRP